MVHQGSCRFHSSVVYTQSKIKAILPRLDELRLFKVRKIIIGVLKCFYVAQFFHDVFIVSFKSGAFKFIAI